MPPTEQLHGRQVCLVPYLIAKGDGMSTAVRAPTVGPIVGHTTATTSRIWIRGNETDDSRTVGIAVIYEGKKLVKGAAQYFRLHREYDRTGVADFEGLKPDTTYTVLAASLSLDTPDPMAVNSDEEVFASLPPPEAWRKQLEELDPVLARAEFKTFPAAVEDKLSFVFGSCRYPGLLWLKKRADQIFKHILPHFDGDDAARFFMMVGDQIYADTLPKDIGLAVADSAAEFQERYISAFGAPNTRRLLQRAPTYMILDDHEIEDNWVAGRLQCSKEKRQLFTLAIQAYRSYQWFHGPRNFGDYLYYNFDVAGFPFFVLDERTQRIRDDDDDDLTDNHLLGRPSKGTGYMGQIDHLIAWLDHQQKTHNDRPKFVVSASVFVPNDVGTVGSDRHKKRDDAWAAFPETRKQLLAAILDKGIQNVVFLSGDVHCSNVAEISFFDENGAASHLKALSITSSAFYWPYPFADGDPLNFVHDSIQENDGFAIGNGYVMHYKASGFLQDDNFSKVDIDWLNKQLVVRGYGKDGARLTESILALA